jgi:MerR family copper efflux transcriptional regulator
MKSQSLTEPQAFRWIQRAAMGRRTTMRVVARAVLDSLDAGPRLDPAPGAMFYRRGMRSDGLLTVVEVSRRTGLSRKALRVYEESGIVVPAGRTQAGYRLYDIQALRRLELLRRAKVLGLHLREMTEFLEVAEGCCDKSHPELVTLVQEKLAETEQRLADLRRLHATLSDTLSRLHQKEHRGQHDCDELLCTCQLSENGDIPMTQPIEIEPIEGAVASCGCGCTCCGPASSNAEREAPHRQHEAQEAGCGCGCAS